MDGRKRLKIGHSYQVGSCQGIDSGRVGVAVRQDFAIMQRCWYRPMSFRGPSAVVLLKDDKGYFAPFRGSIKEV
ncbi:MAG: hypothetical protein PHQ43_11595 [Dehalococcoidales bacterium]|nr:hypothetical protein [Dehalococcoidales bacterium]